jgi:acyl-CoA synthetase (AMP-forming)/AMP-acid ligase II
MTTNATMRRASHGTIGDLIRAAGRRFPDRLAVTDGRGNQRTYAQLLDRAGRLANTLRGLGAQPGERVAAMLEDRCEAVEVYAGIALAGCVAVHVNARHTAPELAHVLTDSGARLLVHTPGVTAVVAAATAAAPVASIIGIDPTGDIGCLDYETALAAAAAAVPEERRHADDLAILAYTSGTTGRPKGALVAHSSVVGCARVAPYYYGIEPGSRVTYSASFSFIGTVWAQVFPTLWMGGTVDILGRADAGEWVDRLAATGSAFTYVSSPRIPEFTEALRERPEALKTLAAVMHSGSAAPRSRVLELYDLIGPRLREHWGTTEVVGSLTATRPGDYGPDSAAEDIFTSVGRPLPSAEVKVVGADGAAAGPGVVGELLVRSDTMFGGYWRAPEKDAEAFRDGWFATSDLGSIDAAGYVYLAGRSADLIVSGGANVYPAEVERVIQDMPAVAQVAVFGLPHQRWGETVVAAVIARPGAAVTENDVIAHCAAQLAGYKKPTRVLLVDALPVNASQKLDRKALRVTYADLGGMS